MLNIEALLHDSSIYCSNHGLTNPCLFRSVLPATVRHVSLEPRWGDVLGAISYHRESGREFSANEWSLERLQASRRRNTVPRGRVQWRRVLQVSWMNWIDMWFPLFFRCFPHPAFHGWVLSEIFWVFCADSCAESRGSCTVSGATGRLFAARPSCPRIEKD